MNENNVKMIFYKDSREKKRTSIGIHNRASRRGYIKGGIRTAYDFMTPKERKKLNGEVKVYNMYDTYKVLENCDLEEILKKENNEIKNILTVVKANNTCNSICEKFSISNGKLYNLYKKYGVAYNVGRKTESKVDLSEILIPKEKFKLMDTLQKGEYVSNISNKYNITLVKIAEFMNITKASIAYYVKVYLKKRDKVKEIKPKSKKINQLEEKSENMLDLKQEEVKQNNDTNKVIEIEQLQEEPEIKETESNDILVEIEKEKEFKEKIAELEKKNNNLEEKNRELIEKLISITDRSSTNFKIELNGEYTKEELSGRLLSLSNMMIKNNTYKVRIILEEI